MLASGTSGKSVVFAGVTVLLAISGMFLVDNVIFTSLAMQPSSSSASPSSSRSRCSRRSGDPRRQGEPWRLGFLRPQTVEAGGIWGRISDYVLAHLAAITVVTSSW